MNQLFIYTHPLFFGFASHLGHHRALSRVPYASQYILISHLFYNSISSVQFSRSVMSDSLWPHESQHARPPCPSPTPTVYSNSCQSSRWCHPAISSSVTPFSCPQSLPASGSFPLSQLFAWGGQSIGVSTSASVLPVNTQDWSPLGWTGWISLSAVPVSQFLVCVLFNSFFHMPVQLSAGPIDKISPRRLPWAASQSIPRDDHNFDFPPY